MKHLRSLNKYFSQYKWKLLLGVFFVVGSNIFRVLQPQYIRDALDNVISSLQLLKEPGADTQAIMSTVASDLLFFALIVVGLAILMGIFMYYMRQTMIVVSRLIEYDLRKDLFKHYETLDVSFFKKNKTGDLMARITEDVSKVRMYLGPGILYFINTLTIFIFVIVSMFSVSAKLSLLTLIPLPILSISIYYVSDIIHKKSTKIQQRLSQLNSIAQESYSGIRVIKSHVMEKITGKFFSDRAEDYKNESMELAKVNAFFHPLMLLLIGISTAITIYFGGIMVASGEITAGNILEFIIYVNMLTWPIAALGWIASIIQQAEASQQRLNEFLDVKSEIHNSNNNVYPIEGQIEFKNVRFTYPETGIEAIKGISFKLKAGEKIAIVGRTASGKSTVAELILRMYDVNQGQIHLDGKDIKSHNLGHIRERIGYVPQDVFLFSDTVADNISFGRPDVSLDDIKKYAEYASIHKDIMELPEQYETMVGERGVTMSGGQKQRISIARALIKDPDIIILDDCLSAVDSETERNILNYLQVALKEKTSIIITHRVGNLMDVDKIIVLENGEILEEGSHNELMEIGGFYHSIYEQQKRQEQLL